MFHLYDPATQTAYRNKVSDNSHPKPEGFEWVEGQPPEGSNAYTGPKPLSTRLADLLKQAGQQLSADPNPSPETLQLVDSVMTINGKLKNIAEDFGGDTPLYRNAAIGYLNTLGVIPDPALEQVRQAMLTECGA